jgi:hypothetical protein
MRRPLVAVVATNLEVRRDLKSRRLVSKCEVARLVEQVITISSIDQRDYRVG